MSKIRIAFSYSPSVGGQSSESVRAILHDLNDEVVNADYRELVTLPNESIEALIEHDASAIGDIFKEALAKAEIFLADKDGLVIPGNVAMVDPRFYGKEKDDKLKTDLGRAIAEMALIEVASKRGMPIMGICGGHQILNIYHGGSLKQLDSASLKKQKFFTYDNISLDPTSELTKMAGHRRSADVFGAHNEAVEEVGGKDAVSAAPAGYTKDLLSVAARASDGSVEAVVSNYGVPVYGLQFHPEVAVKGLPGAAFQVKGNTGDVQFAKNLFTALQDSAETFRRKRIINQEILKNYFNKGGLATTQTSKQSRDMITPPATRGKIEYHSTNIINRLVRKLTRWIVSSSALLPQLLLSRSKKKLPKNSPKLVTKMRELK